MQTLKQPRLAESDLPTPSPENADDKLQAERAVLEALAFKLIAQRSKVRLELGHTFIRLKATLKRGCWESYYAETFGEYEISLRTAQRWMDLADARIQNDKVTPYEPAADLKL